MTTKNTAEIQLKDKPWQFKAGQSGNPSGRPRGSLNKATLAAQALLEGEAEAITRKVIELALQGDMAALRLTLERIVPPRRDTPVSITLPSISESIDVIQAMDAIIQAVSNGEITPSEANALSGIIEQQRRNIETAVLEQKIAHLETILKSR